MPTEVQQPVIAAPFARTATDKPHLPLTPDAIYGFAHLIRCTEELILDLFGAGQVSGTTHTCLGQEICQMAVVRSLGHPRDAVLSNHRNHGHFLTYSGDVLGLLAEVMGREAGVCRGFGGSQHIAYRHFHSNGVQAGMTAIGVGEALARRRAGDGSLVCVLIGDGTLGEGLLYESLNLSAIWKVPLLFVVEDNKVAQTTATHLTTAGQIAARGAAFGLPTWELDDADDQFLSQAAEVVSAVRDSGEPGLLVIETRRLGPHSKGDDLREAIEMDEIRQRDPLTRWGRALTLQARTAIEQANLAYLDHVKSLALASPPSRFVDPPRHVFGAIETDQDRVVSAPPAEPRQSMRSRLNQALQGLLEDDPSVLLLGEDLHDPYGGAFKITKGLSQAHPDRVISTPISEAAIVGAGIGLAMAGYRPIVEVMFADFLTLAADQIYNHAVKFAALFPDISVPLVIRTPSGGRRGYGPTHSQSPEHIFVSIPGLTVVYPSHRHDVGQVLQQAVAWDHPTIFFEHKLLYGLECDPGEFAQVPHDPRDPGGRLFPTLRHGSANPDVTLVTYGGMLPLVELIASQLAMEEELAVELVVPSLLAPFPRHTLAGILMNRPRIVVLEESPVEFSVGAELGAILAEGGYRGEFARLGSPAVPVPSARSLEEAVLWSHTALARQILKLF